MKKILTDKRVLMTVLSIILVLVVMSSTTYALFFKVHTMENTESYTAGILEITVEEGTALTLNNSLPITDEEGASLTPYTFKVTNTGNLAYTFDLKILSTTTSNQINPAYIKVKLDDNSPVTLSSLSEGLIANDLTLNPSESITMSVRIWLSINTPNTEIGKNFSAKIVTDGVGSEYVEPEGVLATEYVSSIFTNADKTTVTNNSVEYQYAESVGIMEDIGGNIRYYGGDPNNYVSFNNELWRIIGVFKDIDDGTGKTETRLKIARSESIGNYAWDSNNKNEWSTATLNTYLNGDYLNSLSSEAQGMIGNAKWNLGGSSTQQGLYANDYYTFERGTTVLSGRSTEWTGKIALMYPSDYMYAGDLSKCSKDGYNWDTDQTNCRDTSWLRNASNTQWTVTPRSSSSSSVFSVTISGFVSTNSVTVSYASRPVLYLSSTVEITGGTGTSEDPYTLQGPPSASEETLTKLGLSVSEGNPDFSKTAQASCSDVSTCETTNGIYAAEDDLGTSYYFRGSVENNYVNFAGYLWRIIRINGDGTIRMILNDVVSMESYNYSDINYFNRAVGYMYGNGESTYEEAHSNINDSSIKIANDSWYETYILNTDNSQFVADAIYCNDRSLSSGTGFGAVDTSYKAYYRLITNKTPSLLCLQDNDKFTVSNELGNGALTYPIGLITADEISYAGGINGKQNNGFYLFNKYYYWTMTPHSHTTAMSSYANIFSSSVGNDFSSSIVSDSYNYLRPVISLKSDLKFVGDGTFENPFSIVS